MNWSPRITFFTLALLVLPRPSHAQADCGDVPSARRIVTIQQADGHFSLFQKRFFATHWQPKNHVLLWELESTDARDSAVVMFDQDTPFAASRFVFRHQQPACSGMPVVAEGAKEYRYTLRVYRHGVATPETIDPGVIIEGPSMDYPIWRIFVY